MIVDDIIVMDLRLLRCCPLRNVISLVNLWEGLPLVLHVTMT